MTDVHESLSSMFAANQFEPFIRHIRFPHFRNLREGTRIEFQHPITALVGLNGTNKTAILRALQGCPGDANLGQYWFSTTLDPIRPEDRHRFVYGYVAQSIGELVEVIKSRINREGDPDYFEPARPILRDGMAKMPPIEPGAGMPPERSGTRWRPIAKNVVYLDFRSELSAYDKYFFHMPFKRKLADFIAKKSFIRKRAGHLRESIMTGRKSHTFYRSERIISPAADLSSDQVAAVSEILGRSYESIRVCFHRYFDVDGATVILKTFGMTYSEAFAGSGEFAVVMLVKGITEAPERSLILLDEPEVSLHPGAQRKLMAFASAQTKLKRHHVVISTHSAEIVRDLPSKAIKVFHHSATDGKIELLGQESEPSEAFFRLGLTMGEKLTIFVEDGLAAAVVRRALRPLGEALNSVFEIAPLPGGSDTIRKLFIPNFALSGRRRCLVLLDGDQRPTEPLRDPAHVPDIELAAAAGQAMFHAVPLPLNGSEGRSAPGQRESQLRVILEWASRNLDYLPGTTPEKLLLAMEGANIAAGIDGKKTWLDRTRASLGREDWENVTSAEVLASIRQRVLISRD